MKKNPVDTMMRKDVCVCKKVLFFLLFLFFFAATAHAEVVYVTDRLLVMLRSEQGGGEKIAKLFSDTPLQLLEKSGRYVKVRTEDGQEGWVEEQYTTTEPPKQIVITSLEVEIKRLEANLNQLAKERGPLGEQLEKSKREHAEQVKMLEENASRLQNERDQLATRFQEMEAAYRDIREKSGNAVETADQLKRLQAEYSQLEVQNKLFREENATLKKKDYLYWFFAGAGVLFLGWIIGRIPRRRGSGKLSM
ncbi:MAG: TIGR04211 family SH3 domain-containing protein [Desulfobacterales bacterium]|nr:MAG: TIGR04211 family SH3 domain-containing protein [Desulfobacterales bacterium]